MGTIFKRGKKWGISYVDPHGRQVRRMIASYRETAQRILSKIETDIVEGKYLDVKKTQQVLFEDFSRQYLEMYMRLENKNADKQQVLLNNLLEFFRGKHLHQIDSVMIRQYLAKRLNEVKPSTVNRHFSMLKCMFNRAIEWGMFFGPNPTKGIKKIAENNSRCRWLTEEEQIRLLSHCYGITKVIVLVALKTGMRWGEIIQLKWRQASQSNYVDFENETIVIHESLTKGRSSRFIPLSKTLKEALLTVPKVAGNDYIFQNPETQKPLGSIKKSFKTALKRAGINDFTFHDLRHTFASQLVRNGVDLYVVQKLLGHTTPKMTQRYAHLSSHQLKDAIEKIDAQSGDFVYNTSFTKAVGLSSKKMNNTPQVSPDDSTNLAQIGVSVS